MPTYRCDGRRNNGGHNRRDKETGEVKPPSRENRLSEAQRAERLMARCKNMTDFFKTLPKKAAPPKRVAEPEPVVQGALRRLASTAWLLTLSMAAPPLKRAKPSVRLKMLGIYGRRPHSPRPITASARRC